MPVVEKGFVKVGQADYEAIMRLAFGKSLEKSAQAGGQKSSDKPVGNEDLLYGALAGMGSGLLSDMMTPLDEDESPLKRALTRILHGAALGGVAGLGIRTVRRLGGGKPQATAPSEKAAAAGRSAADQERRTDSAVDRSEDDELVNNFLARFYDTAAVTPGNLWRGYLTGAGGRLVGNSLWDLGVLNARRGVHMVPQESVLTQTHALNGATRNVNVFDNEGVPAGVSGTVGELSDAILARANAKKGVPALNAELELIRRLGLLNNRRFGMLRNGVSAFNDANPNHQHATIADAFRDMNARMPDNAFGPTTSNESAIANELADILSNNVHGEVGNPRTGYQLYGENGVFKELENRARVFDRNRAVMQSKGPVNRWLGRQKLVSPLKGVNKTGWLFALLNGLRGGYKVMTDTSVDPNTGEAMTPMEAEFNGGKGGNGKQAPATPSKP